MDHAVSFVLYVLRGPFFPLKDLPNEWEDPAKAAEALTYSASIDLENLKLVHWDEVSGLLV
jgi:hypothetical protein